MTLITLNWRIIRFLLVFFCATVLLFHLYTTYLPPEALYNELYDAELRDSKKIIHNKQGNKYVKFRQLQGAGFNNQAQEILLFHHLALQTSRVYVYQPLIWRPRGEKATVPLSAFLLGPTLGTVSDAVFQEVCPLSEIVHISLAVDHMRQWDYAKRSLDSDSKCIVVDDWLFRWSYLQSPGIHTIWPSFQEYLTNHFRWSDNVLAIVDRTQAKLRLKSRPDDVSLEREPYMALHLRRGDFEGHCKILGERHEGTTTWATLPFVQPAMFPPSLDIFNDTSIMQHCYPTLYRILDAVSHQARSHPHLRRLHVLHDGAWDHPLVYRQYYQLANALKNTAWTKKQGWKNGPMLHVTHSGDVPIARGERDWSVCVDVELGRRADVFIGNGYSSLSTQIIAMRLGADNGTVEDLTLL